MLLLLLCAWQRHWHKSLDRKRCEPCCAHNNFYVAIKRRLLVCLFVHLAFAFQTGRGHCKLKSKSVNPANDCNREEKEQLVSQVIILWSSRSAASSLSSTLVSKLFVALQANMAQSFCRHPGPNCVSALVDHRPQHKYVLNLTLFSSLLFCLRFFPSWSAL